MDSLFSPEQLPIVQALANLGFTNPFGTERIKLEKIVLGHQYTPAFQVWVITPTHQGFSPNLTALAQSAEQHMASAQQRLKKGYQPQETEWQLYGELALYTLYYRYESEFYKILTSDHLSRVVMPFYRHFAEHWHSLIGKSPLSQAEHWSAAHMFALFFQIRRAFHFIFRAILGTSQPAAQLRMAVWQSIFGHDVRRYHRALYLRMHEVSTLILGESGTGKELVASAIGLARYIPFNPKTQRFEGDYLADFQAVHLAALPLTLLESELFGHRKGSFTGATSDRAGYLETQHHGQSVFLDEVGELPAEVQVKLLRVLQNRRFQRLGDNQSREFYGKIISATHRDLAADIEKGLFRADLYYRLCSDIIRTPSLAVQLADNADELAHLVTLVTAKIVSSDIANEVAAEAQQWISQHLSHYRWHGNMRELEQCVRSILIHGYYYPAQSHQRMSPIQQFTDKIAQAQLNYQELTSQYYALVYQKTGSYEAAGQLLGTNWRTVKTHIDTTFLQKLQSP
ncbi:sigma-54-dependent transcriptional regulator [Agitococcus lubricus]|uniref:Sigma-54 interacting transcriptional regulator n=1 Tax=Agitococcus lubricus TaxID=1077255 RepID=A0A2T5IS91_9GAMM|nr:sigma 54-interacting transcriptional regulator [Agitococcus lubricus]PTQ86706.1 sigma-54 interacting transcriptional regulator [Agitococcus lubricus]